MELDELLEKARQRGTDRQFRAYIQTLPSCLSGQFSEYVNGEGRCIAAHIRRAGESGMAFKAEYACVPLTNDEHQAQHRWGETYFKPKEWWDRKRIEYLTGWINR